MKRIRRRVTVTSGNRRLQVVHADGNTSTALLYDGVDANQ